MGRSLLEAWLQYCHQLSSVESSKDKDVFQPSLATKKILHLPNQ